MYDLNKKLILIILISLSSFSLWAREINTEVGMEASKEVTPKEIESTLRELGLKKGFEQVVQELKLNLEQYNKVLTDKNFSKEEYQKHLESFFTNIEFIRIVSVDIKSDSNPTGVIKAQVDDEQFKKIFIQFVENLDLLKEKNFYIDLDYTLVGKTSWEDLGVSTQTIFEEAVDNSFRDHLLKEFPGFQNIIFLEEKERKLLEINKDLITNESYRYKFSFSIRKVYEDKDEKIIQFEVDAHFVLVGVKDGHIVYSYEFPTQKKVFRNVKSADLSSSLATLVFNICKMQTPIIKDKLANDKTENKNLFSLSGQKFFSDIYAVKNVLTNFLSKYNPNISIVNLNLNKTDFKIDVVIDPKEGKKLQDLLINMGKLPLSNDPNEKKVLVFDNEHNSFAINQKD